MKIKLNFSRTAFILLTVTLLLVGGCSKKESTSSSSSSTSSLTSGSLPVTEITQSIEGGYYTGSFAVPSDGVSFLLSIFNDSNANVGFSSLTDPDGTDILSSTSTPNLYNDASGSLGSDVPKAGYSNVLVPQSPSFSAKAGTWTFKAKSNDRVKLALRTGTVPSSTTIVVQPYITGTTWQAADLSAALSIMSSIYSSNGITLTINSTISISDTQYAVVSRTFTNSTTSALVSQGVKGAVNLFFIKDFSSSGILGIAAGMPGSMGIANSWNGVLIGLMAHASGSTLNSQLLGETAAHEMGHQLGLFHTTEMGGTVFDILTDTPECTISRDNISTNGIVSAEECDGYGASNIMFWTTWSTASRSAGKKQEVLCRHQQHVL
ncbi:MAG: zinc-dependent metalloprotease family protein, partial [SAR324 cluster bacterium]|nr:zinc-dependent metalloprotease family protein [SAR324 cluster bacterium]